jgi:hypothetical protein
VVCREAKDARGGRVAVDDSKRLKRPNSVRRGSPIEHLERSVRCFLGAMGEGSASRPSTDAALLASLSADLGGAAWYGGEAAALAGDARAIGVDANALRVGLDRAGVRPLDLRCATMDEAAFNGAIRRRGSKAGASFECVARLLRRVWETQGAHAPRVVVDRQGGRTRYAEALRMVSASASVRTMGETAEASRYEILGSGVEEGRRMIVHFEVGADQTSLACALASMAAKLVRELAMARFNRHWSARLPEVKPTAGYGVDGRRWIDEVSALISEEERRHLVRLA